MLGRADPDPPAIVFEQLADELSVELMRRPLEAATFTAPQLQPAVAADPHPPFAIEQQRPHAIRGQAVLIASIVAEVIDASRARIDAVQSVVRADPC